MPPPLELWQYHYICIIMIYNNKLYLKMIGCFLINVLFRVLIELHLAMFIAEIVCFSFIFRFDIRFFRIYTHSTNWIFRQTFHLRFAILSGRMFSLRRRLAFVTTLIELVAIAISAIIGCNKPRTANGIAITL